jgi:hypothetical protein
MLLGDYTQVTMFTREFTTELSTKLSTKFTTKEAGCGERVPDQPSVLRHLVAPLFQFPPGGKDNSFRFNQFPEVRIGHHLGVGQTVRS